MRIAMMEQNDEKLDSVSCDVAGEKSKDQLHGRE